MKRRIPDPILMVITILVIIGFQVYWLKDNYDREKRTMEIKTGVAFQEAIRKLQMAKFKLPEHFIKDSTDKGKQNFLINEDYSQSEKNSSRPRSQIITMVNTLRNSVKKDSSINSTVIIATGKHVQMDFKNGPGIKFRRNVDSNDHAFNILYGVDSLQDSLKLPEIIKAYSATLKKENLDIPFTVTRSDTASFNDEQELSDVTVGFAHPVTYKLSLGSAAPYLARRITLPILFSIFLVGVTIFSFVLLYRNLLRQQKLAEIKNEFISNMTHELKTPIATVGVAIEALKNFNAIRDPQKTKEYLDISANELQRLGLLVDKVLKLSMFEKREVELNKEHFDMRELTQGVLDTMKLQFEKNKAVVTFNTVGNNFIINADKLHITSVIYNLLDNALKYHSDDPVINVQLSAQQNNIELSVTDNGIGIAPEYQIKIFDKFFRVPTGNRHVVKGYGLGLSYVSHIISQHKGTIYVESELNKGSTFIIKIPMYGEG